VRVAREEQAMLQECVELLSQVSALQVISIGISFVDQMPWVYYGSNQVSLFDHNLQVEEQSLRTHLVQSASLSAVIVK